MLERAKLEQRLQWGERAMFPTDKELLKEYPLIEYVEESDAMITEDRVNPKEVTDNAKKLTERVEAYEEEYARKMKAKQKEVI